MSSAYLKRDLGSSRAVNAHPTPPPTAPKGATILITGGAGFIGSSLASQLVEDNQIILFDNFHRNALAGTGLEEHPNVRVIRGDVLDRHAVDRAMVDAIETGRLEAVTETA